MREIRRQKHDTGRYVRLRKIPRVFLKNAGEFAGNGGPREAERGMYVQRRTETQTHQLQRSLAQVHPQVTTPVPGIQALPCAEDLLHVNRAGRRSVAIAASQPPPPPIATRRAFVVVNSDGHAHAIIVGALSGQRKPETAGCGARIARGFSTWWTWRRLTRLGGGSRVGILVRSAQCLSQRRDGDR